MLVTDEVTVEVTRLQRCNWDRNLVKAELETALDTLRRVPEGETWLRQPLTSWPAIIRTWWERQAMEPAGVTLARPTAAALDRAHQAIGWLFWLGPRERKIVSGRCGGASWRRVCAEVRLGRTRATFFFDRALDRIAYRLNELGVPVVGRD